MRCIRLGKAFTDVIKMKYKLYLAANLRTDGLKETEMEICFSEICVIPELG